MSWFFKHFRRKFGRKNREIDGKTIGNEFGEKKWRNIWRKKSLKSGIFDSKDCWPMQKKIDHKNDLK
jgi:hypothetical protein